MTKYLSVFLAFLCIENGLGFVAKPLQASSTTRASAPLSMVSSNNDNGNGNTNLMVNGKSTAASVLAAAFLFSNVLAVAPAFAAAPGEDFAGSSQVVAARSGGRMGGRSSMGSRGGGGAPSYSRSYSRTTVVRPMVTSPVIVAPMSPFGFNPFGGFGT